MRTWLIAVIVAGGALRPALGQDAPKVDQGQVDQAVKKGVAFVMGRVPDRQPWRHYDREVRYDELILWTFVHGGVLESDELFQELLKKTLESRLEVTYLVSLQAMILEELDRVAYQVRIQACAQFLVDNQCKNGQWSYGDPSRKADEISTGWKAPVATGSPRSRGAKPKVMKRATVKRTREGPDAGDNSNSQLALLGLRACRDAGIDVPRETVLRARRWWETAQHADGGWCYGGCDGAHAAHKSYGSMTDGGVGSLVLCRGLLGESWKSDARIARGVAWLTDRYSVRDNPGPIEFSGQAMHLYYFHLYALERACTLYGTEKLGPNSWYVEGARALLERQHSNGSWESTHGGNAIWDTCFAILFLRRATRPLEDVPTVDDHEHK